MPSEKIVNLMKYDVAIEDIVYLYYSIFFIVSSWMTPTDIVYIANNNGVDVSFI